MSEVISQRRLNFLEAVRLFPRNPEPFYSYMARKIVQWCFRPNYEGFEQLPDEGAAVLISNHISYVDGIIINAACKRPVRYVIDEDIYNLPIVNYFMRCNKAIPILPKRESVERALDMISEGLKNGDVICIFPEGQLTYTGALGRFRPGIEYIIQRDPVPVYPIALKGLWGSFFSRKYRKASFLRKLTMSMRRKRVIKALCGPPLQPEHVSVDQLQRIVLSMRNSL